MVHGVVGVGHETTETVGIVDGAGVAGKCAGEAAGLQRIDVEPAHAGVANC